MQHQILVLKPAAFANVDIRVRVSGGGHSSQIYAIRQAIAKAIVAYTAKYEDAAQALDLKKQLLSYDRTLLVADPRRCEPKQVAFCHGKLEIAPVLTFRQRLQEVRRKRCTQSLPEILPVSPYEQYYKYGLGS
jgi:hypothetical protein